MTADVSLLVLAVVSCAQLLVSVVTALTRPKTDPALEAFVRGLPELCLTLTRPEYVPQYKRATQTANPDPAKEDTLPPVELMNGEY